MTHILVVGAGGVADLHAEAWENIAGARVTGVVDTDRNRARRLAERFQAEHYTSVEEALEHGSFDFADVCTPEHVHARVGVSLMDSGVPALTEKMLASSLDEGGAMLVAAERSGTWNGVNFNYHWVPALRQLKRIIDAGDDEIQHLTVITHSLCWHHLIEATIWLLGMPRMVWAWGVERSWSEESERQFRIAPDLVYLPGNLLSVRLSYRDGSSCTIQGSNLPDVGKMPFCLNAVMKSGNCYQADGLQLLGDMEGRFGWLPEPAMAPEEGDASSFQESFESSLRNAVDAFKRGEPAESTWQDGWNAMVLEHAIHLAGSSNASVEPEVLTEQLNETHRRPRPVGKQRAGGKQGAM